MKILTYINFYTQNSKVAHDLKHNTVEF